MPRLLSFLLLTLIASPLYAWTPETEQRIAAKSATLAPTDLRWVLEQYSSDFRRGLESASARDNSAGHRFHAGAENNLRNELLREIEQSVAGMRARKGMSGFAESLGRIAHLVGEANNPFNSGKPTQRLEASRIDYEHYLQRRQSKFMTVFYGLEKQLVPAAYIDGMLRRSARFYPLLEEEYFRSGERGDSSDFDDRSTAFGIAAVSYSRSVSDLVNLYFHIWKESGGDTRTAATLQKGNLLLNEQNDD